MKKMKYEVIINVNCDDFEIFKNAYNTDMCGCVV